MAAGKKDSNSGHHASSLHLVTPAAALEALREPTAGVDLMNRHNLNRYEGESGRNLRRGISHFLSPQLQVLIKEKPRIALAEKAEFAELLSEELSGRPIQELSIDLLRRSFMIRRRVANGSSPSDDDDEASAPGRPPIPPDVPFAEQTTNKASPAFAKKVSEVEADLELIVDNATAFNRPNDPVYQFALELQAVFRSELSMIRRAGGGGQGGREDGQIDKRPRMR